MSLKNILAIFILNICMSPDVRAQYLHDSEFLFVRNAECLPKNICTPLYYKAHIDPQISDMDSVNMACFLADVINKTNLDSTTTGILKLKLVFLLGNSICLYETGNKNLMLSTLQYQILRQNLSILKPTQYGTVNHQDVSSQGILYIWIKNGKFERFLHQNFLLKDQKSFLHHTQIKAKG
jgi:hypothetical protein